MQPELRVTVLIQQELAKSVRSLQRRLCNLAGVWHLHTVTTSLLSPDGASGQVWGTLQPSITLRALGVLQHCPQAALPLFLSLLSSPDLQAESIASALLRGHATHGHLPVHPLLSLRGMWLLRPAVEWLLDGTTSPHQWDNSISHGPTGKKEVKAKKKMQ